MAKNPCKYWIEDEAAVCAHWDSSKTICTLVKTVEGKKTIAQLAPYCNMLGTADYVCKDYYSAGARGTRCVLPDPSRHVTNKKTCNKWVRSTAAGTTTDDGTEYSGYPIYAYNAAMEAVATGDFWTFEDIKGYEGGSCDEEGTDVTCPGYSPGIMAFGRLRPKEAGSEDIADFENIVTCYKDVELGFRIPLPYVIFNIRALLSKCYWWDGPPAQFSIGPDGKEVPFTCKCAVGDDNVERFWDYQLDEEYGYIAPCNGAKHECPHYTGICWEYCIDSKMVEGAKILAEQILELRYYIKREHWGDKSIGDSAIGEPVTTTLYQTSFKDPDIYSWTGTYELSVNINTYTSSAVIDSVRNYFSHFDFFEVAHDVTTLTNGIPSDTQASDFPTLVRELQYPQLAPIIRNVFDDQIFEETDVTGIENVFETGDIDHTSLVIWGESFIYGSSLYTINLNDPELLKRIPNELLDVFNNNTSIYEAVANYSDEHKEEFNTLLNDMVQQLVNFMPDSLYTNELPYAESGFYIHTNTFFGDNTVVVLEYSNGTWEFDKVSFTKVFCGGVIAQTSFYIDGDGKQVKNNHTFQRSFCCDSNDNGEMSFRFLSLDRNKSDGEIAYIYNATADSKGAMHNTYKIPVLENATLTSEHVKFFGNAGKAVVIIPDTDKLLNYVHRVFELKDDIILTIVDVDGNSKNIVMQIKEWCSSALEINQIVIEPKQVIDFSRACSFTLLIPGLYSFQQRSFGEAPEEGILISSGNLDKCTLELDVTGTFKIEKFSNQTVMLSVAYKSSSGRIKGVTRTKPIMWVRQPYCRDVQISYAWSANYTRFLILPTGMCYGPRGRIILDTKYGGSAPPCGDHDLSKYSPIGPVWYPYDACFATWEYNDISSAHAPITDTMEVFDEAEHGNWDMRMLGPVDNSGYEESHASVWQCNCDYFYYNFEKNSNNMFSGTCKYRGQLDFLAYEYCTRYGGSPPKFGNVCRDQLNSYRTMDYVTFWRQSGLSLSWSEDARWMPISQHYTLTDVTAPAADYHIDLYTDDYNNPFVHQLGLFKVSTIEGINISETVDETNRFKFAEVFYPHATTTAIYPMPRPAQIMGQGDEAKPVMCWYTYHDYPEDTSRAIQWAWQEKWHDIDRTLSLHLDILVEQEMVGLSGPQYELPYKSGIGVHSFLYLSHPMYVLDYKQNEHQLVCEEGLHTIRVVPSRRTDVDSDVSQLFIVCLDNGPPKVFDLSGEFLDEVPEEGLEFEGYDIGEINTSLSMYTICSDLPWDTASNLFDVSTYVSDDPEDLESTAESDNRRYSMYENGLRVDYYFNRGLYTAIIPSKLEFLPRTIRVLKSMEYDWAFNRPALNPPYDSIEPGEYIPAQLSPDILYYSNTGNITTDIKFLIPEDEPNEMFIDRVTITYNYGADIIGDIIERPDSSGNVPDEDDSLYHIPGLTISKKSGGSTAIVWAASPTLATKDSPASGYINVTYDIPYSVAAMETPYDGLVLTFDTNLDPEELATLGIDAYYGEFIHKVNIVSIVLRTVNFTSAIENLNTYERRYYVSHGTYPDYPIQGTNSTDNLLRPLYNELSTPWHIDTHFGVLGLQDGTSETNFMSKTSGRLLTRCYDDSEYVPGSDLSSYEEEQKKIYDENVLQGATTFTVSSVCPPGLEDILSNIGLRFPRWSCSFRNTMVFTLADVIAQNTFSPCGYKWSSTVYTPRQMTCGPGSVVPDYFKYMYINPCTGDYYIGNGWMEAQYQAAINRAEMGWINFLGALSTPLIEEKTRDYGYTSTVNEEALTTMTLPL